MIKRTMILKILFISFSFIILRDLISFDPFSLSLFFFFFGFFFLEEKDRDDGEIRSCINPDRVLRYREMYELERFRCKLVM